MSDMDASLAIEEYQTEESLVEEFCALLETDASPWGSLSLAREFSYHNGRTDVVGVDVNGHVIAFEMKLARWTDAMQQAYRNTSFANCSYVVLPKSIADRAEVKLQEFIRRSVGICCIKNGGIVVTLPAVHQTPIQPWVSRAAILKAREWNERSIEE
jgi:hypothetical protein